MRRRRSAPSGDDAGGGEQVEISELAGKRASIGTVAQRAGVSIATVSRILNEVPNRASAATILRVRAAARDLDYRPSRAGSTLRSGRSRVVALLVPDPANAYNAAVAASVEQALRRSERSVVLCGTGEDPAVQDEFLLEMQAHAVCGIVLLGAVPSPVLRQFVTEGQPIVFVNRRDPTGTDAAFVGIDDRRAGREVADHFLRRSYAPCALLHGPLDSSATLERVRGFSERLAEAGHALDPAYVVARGSHADPMTSGYRCATPLLTLAPRPRAIFCTTDESAFGVYRRCRELGVAVPGEVALFGFDGNPLIEFLAPWLSTVSVPYSQFGPAVAEIFDQIWGGEPRLRSPEVIFPHRLIVTD